MPQSNILITTDKGFYNFDLIVQQNIDKKNYQVPVSSRINISPAEQEIETIDKTIEEQPSTTESDDPKSIAIEKSVNEDDDFIQSLFYKDRSRLGKRDDNYKIRYFINNIFENDSLYYIGFAIENVHRDSYYNETINAFHLINVDQNEVEKKSVLSRKEKRKLPELSNTLPFEIVVGAEQFQAEHQDRYTVALSIPKASLKPSPGDYLKFIFIEGNEGVRSLNLLLAYKDFIKNIIYIE